MAHSLSGHLTDENDQPLNGITVHLFKRNTTTKKWDPVLPDDVTPHAANDWGLYRFDGLDPGKYKIEPDADNMSFDPQFIITKPNKNKSDMDFEQIKVPRTNDGIEQQYVKDVLAACLESVDAWTAFVKNGVPLGTQGMRKQVIHAIHTMLAHQDDPPLVPSFDADLSPEERSVKIREWQRQQHEMVDQAAAEASGQEYSSHNPRLLCSTCRDQYNINHNYAALVQCMNNPPCTP